MPLPKKLVKTINKMAKRDRKFGKKFYPYTTRPGDSKLYVLQQNGRDKKFDILATIDAYGVDFDEYRDRTVFSVSTVREDFGKNNDETFFQVVMKSTHIAKSNGEIYKTNNGDGVQAYHFDWSYKIFAIHQSQMSFALSDTVGGGGVGDPDGVDSV